MEKVTVHRANQPVIKDLTGRIIRGEPIAVSDRSVGRDYTFVADIAGGIYSVLIDYIPRLSHCPADTL